ncbi:hypothetical protein PtB15_12B478 [Puccinia triticina]|nr:hypothetical protein PtB15_12B478 [Puccinia triticina]
MHIRTSLALLISLQVVSQVASYWPPLRSKAQAHGGESSASDTGLSSARADASLGRSDFGRSSDYHPGGLGATSDDPSSAGSPAAGGTGSARTKNPSSKSGSSATLSESDSGSSSGGPYDGRAYQGQATTYDSKWSIGNCLLSKWPQPKGLGPVAIAQNLWDSSRMCGACVSITSSFGTYLGIITDQSDVNAASFKIQ